MLYNLVLVAFVWSYGAVLPTEMRHIFDDKFHVEFKNMFAIGFSVPSSKRFTLFEIYYDIEHLRWQALEDKLEYKIKMHFEPGMHSLIIPTTGMAQAYHLLDRLGWHMHF